MLDEDHLYLVSRAGTAQERLLALRRRPDAGTKAVAWSASLPSAENWREPSAMPILAAGIVVVPAESALLAFAAASGRRLWRYQASTPLRWLTTSGPQIFAVDESGTIHAVDSASGKSSWRLATGSAEPFEEGDWRGGARLAARAGSVLFVQKGRLVAVDAGSRALRWTGPVVSEVSFGETTAFVAFPDGEAEDQVGVVDLRDGRVRWRRQLDELLLTAPRVAEREGIVLVRPHAEVLYAFELGSGALRWKIDLGTGELPFSDEEIAPVRDHTLIGPAAQGS
jgi:outer membrane protein assembly factor BamB